MTSMPNMVFQFCTLFLTAYIRMSGGKFPKVCFDSPIIALPTFCIIPFSSLLIAHYFEHVLIIWLITFISHLTLFHIFKTFPTNVKFNTFPYSKFIS
jgi:hypothetical protein